MKSNALAIIIPFSNLKLKLRIKKFALEMKMFRNELTLMNLIDIFIFVFHKNKIDCIISSLRIKLIACLKIDRI